MTRCYQRVRLARQIPVHDFYARQVRAVPRVGVVKDGRQEPCEDMSDRSERNKRLTNDEHEANHDIGLGPPRRCKGTP